MLEIQAIDHVVLRTTRMPDMLAFYRDFLGCPVERELDPKVGLVQLRAGSGLIDLVPVDSELGKQGGGAPRNRLRPRRRGAARGWLRRWQPHCGEGARRARACEGEKRSDAHARRKRADGE